MAPESWFSIYFLLFFDVGSTFFTYRIFIYGILYLYTKKSGNNCFQISPRGANQIWTGDRGVADLCLTTWLWRHALRTVKYNKYVRWSQENLYVKIQDLHLPEWLWCAAVSWNIWWSGSDSRSYPVFCSRNRHLFCNKECSGWNAVRWSERLHFLRGTWQNLHRV